MKRRSISEIESEIADYQAVRRMVIRQITNGAKVTRTAVMVHKNACDRLDVLNAELDRKLTRTPDPR